MDTKLSDKKSLDIKMITEEELNDEIEKGLLCIENDEVMSLEEAFSSLKRVSY